MGPTLVFFMWLSSNLCWKDYIYPLSSLNTIVENPLTIDVWVYLWTVRSFLYYYPLHYHVFSIKLDLYRESRQHGNLRYCFQSAQDFGECSGMDNKNQKRSSDFTKMTVKGPLFSFPWFLIKGTDIISHGLNIFMHH